MTRARGWNWTAGFAIDELSRRVLVGVSGRIVAMKVFCLAPIVVAMLALSAGQVEAKGCLKGAAVGGVAGHYAGHHGVLGAAAGCLYGRHRAKEQERQQQQAPQQQGAIHDNGQTGM
jgi:hypothetical protein